MNTFTVKLVRGGRGEGGGGADCNNNFCSGPKPECGVQRGEKGRIRKTRAVCAK